MDLRLCPPQKKKKRTLSSIFLPLNFISPFSLVTYVLGLMTELPVSVCKRNLLQNEDLPYSLLNIIVIYEICLNVIFLIFCCICFIKVHKANNLLKISSRISMS